MIRNCCRGIAVHGGNFNALEGRFDRNVEFRIGHSQSFIHVVLAPMRFAPTSDSLPSGN